MRKEREREREAEDAGVAVRVKLACTACRVMDFTASVTRVATPCLR